MGQRPVTPILKYQVSLVVEWRGVEFVDSGGCSGVVVEVKSSSRRRKRDLGMDAKRREHPALPSC